MDPVAQFALGLPPARHPPEVGVEPVGEQMPGSWEGEPPLVQDQTVGAEPGVQSPVG